MTTKKKKKKRRKKNRNEINELKYEFNHKAINFYILKNANLLLFSLCFKKDD